MQSAIRVKLALSALVLAVSVIAIPARAQTNDSSSINVGFLNGNWIPFSYRKNDVLQGFAIDVVNIVMKQMRYDVKFEGVRLQRGLGRLESGDLAAFINLGANPERTAKYLFTADPLYYDETILISSQDDPFVFNGDVSTLLGERVGLVKGAIHGPAFDNMKGIIRVPDDSSVYFTPKGYEGILNGSYRFVVISARAGAIHLLKKFGLLDKLTVHVKPIAIKSYYAVFSRNLPNAEKKVKRFDRMHRLFRSTNKYPALLQKYNLNPELFPR